MQGTSNTLGSDAPSLDTLQAALGNRRRRLIVDVLAGRKSTIHLDVLARAVAMRLPSDETRDLDSIATALHHVDLPRLESAGVLAYDPETKAVEPTGTDVLVPFLNDEPTPW